MNRPILIASSQVDEPTYKPVGDILANSGYPVVMYQSDRVLSGEDHYTLHLAEDGAYTARYNGQSIHPDDLSAAWYRKVNSSALPYPEPQLANQLYVNREVLYLHDTMWGLYPDNIWLNSPDSIARADRKLRQQIIAHEVGFAIVQTLVSSDWDEVAASLLPDDESRMVIKMMRGVISDGDKIKALYTHITNGAEADRLARATYAFPALYQPYVQKAREWRVTAVGDEVFSAAIYTSKEAKDDWRRLQMTDAVQFRREALPKGVDEQCLRYLARMGLQFGAFDLIETPEGEIIFLECNPNGQYSWLEDELGLNISSAVATALVKIAKHRS